MQTQDTSRERIRDLESQVLSLKRENQDMARQISRQAAVEIDQRNAIEAMQADLHAARARLSNHRNSLSVRPSEMTRTAGFGDSRATTLQPRQLEPIHDWFDVMIESESRFPPVESVPPALRDIRAFLQSANGMRVVEFIFDAITSAGAGRHIGYTMDGQIPKRLARMNADDDFKSQVGRCLALVRALPAYNDVVDVLVHMWFTKWGRLLFPKGGENATIAWAVGRQPEKRMISMRELYDMYVEFLEAFDGRAAEIPEDAERMPNLTYEQFKSLLESVAASPAAFRDEAVARTIAALCKQFTLGSRTPTLITDEGKLAILQGDVLDDPFTFDLAVKEMRLGIEEQQRQRRR
jgi:hypothetical protein